MYQYKDKIKQIDKLIEQEKYTTAVQALATVIEMINVNTINEKLNQKIDMMNLYDTMEFYRLSDKKRYLVMIDIAYIYEKITNKKMTEKEATIDLRQKCQELINIDRKVE